MQHRSNTKQRGSILAASNFLTFSGILLSAVAFGLMRTEVFGQPLLYARQIFLLCGVLTLPVFIYIAFLIPQTSIRFLAWLVTHTAYRVRQFQAENLPKEGPALLVANHISWLDGLLLVAVSPRPIRLIVSTNLLSSWWSRGLAQIMGAIPVGRGPKATRSAIESARAALQNEELVCIFPEGGISRSGQLQPFKAGALEIVRGTSAPMIPVYLDELWGSIFSFHGGRFFWKWPRRWSRNVSIWFGQSLEATDNIHSVRQAVQDLSAAAVTGRKGRSMLLPQEMIRKCRKAMFRWKIADSTGMQLTGGSLLMRSLLVRRLLQREVLGEDEKYVGVLLPPSVGAVVTNGALALGKQVAVNLNYTTSAAVLNRCIHKAGIRHVLTSRKVLEKLDLEIDAEVILLEDLREKITLADKLSALSMAYITPASLLDRMLGLNTLQSDDELTVIFTSGSTGDPKGVILTYHNIGTNVEAVEHVVHLRSSDVLLGILPFFHSFGYMVTLWAPLSLDVHCVYHFTPLDAKQVGKLSRRWGATVLLSTPTFLRSYLRRCEPEDFEKLNIVVTGAEKMPMPLAEAFDKKYDVRPVEGYGITELSPLVSVNVPPSRSQTGQSDNKYGTVGRPIPGVTVKIVDPDSFAELPIGSDGMLLVKGPNVMAGYLGEPEKTAEMIQDGWYTTGDIARVDSQGFIEITGRLSRFSKIGGEMVPHILIEEAVQKILDPNDEDETIRAVVTSVSDPRKGERLIVLYIQMDLTPDDVCKQLVGQGIAKLWIPSVDSFFQVEAIPLLGTGKLDLKGMSEMAKKLVDES
jgi:acyl-[acyl-carrier-protein]-phospholipid O-acyltransferase/long-chain-fatty-acid--[acyl-carrier-protein] ligase